MRESESNCLIVTEEKATSRILRCSISLWARAVARPMEMEGGSGGCHFRAAASSSVERLIYHGRRLLGSLLPMLKVFRGGGHRSRAEGPICLRPGTGWADSSSASLRRVWRAPGSSRRLSSASLAPMIREAQSRLMSVTLSRTSGETALEDDGVILLHLLKAAKMGEAEKAPDVLKVDGLGLRVVADVLLEDGEGLFVVLLLDELVGWLERCRLVLQGLGPGLGLIVRLRGSADERGEKGDDRRN